MAAEKTGLSEAQVYKWGWDQKRKNGEDVESLQSFPSSTGTKRKSKADRKL